MTTLLLAHLTDCHIDGRPARSLRLAAALERARRWLDPRDPWLDRRDRIAARHLLLTGDVTSHGDLAEYRELGTVLSPWPFGATIVPGNHDGGRERFMEGMRAHFPRFGGWSTPGRSFRIGSARILPIDTGYRRRSMLFRALGEVGEEQLGVIGREVEAARAAREHLVIAMHHGPQGQPGPLGVFKDLSDRKRLSALLEGHAHVSVCCGHDHQVKDEGSVFVAASVATFEGDPLRVYEVSRWGILRSLHRDVRTGSPYAFARRT